MSGKFIVVFLLVAVLAVAVMSNPPRKHRRPPPPKKCSKNEMLLECGSPCEPSCKNPEPKYCPKKCIRNVCQCKKGLLRNEDGKCVDPCDC